MADKVRGGTPKGSTSLCLRCRSAFVVRGLNLEEIVDCRKMEMRMTFRVESCSQFDDKSRPSLYEMERVAWIVTSRNRGPVGFSGERTAEIHIEPPDQNINIRSQQPEGSDR